MSSLHRNRTKFEGDFLVPSFHGNIECFPRNGQTRRLCRTLTKENNDGSVSSLEVANNARRNHCLRTREKILQRRPLKEKNVGESVFTSNSKIFRSCRSSKTSTYFDDPDEEMETARNTTSVYNIDKGLALTLGYNQLKEQHGDFQRYAQTTNSEDDEANCSDSSNITLERKYTQVFQNSYKPEHRIENRKVDKTTETNCQPINKDLKIIMKTLKKIVKTTPAVSRDTNEITKLYDTVKSLQDEQENFRNLIRSQQEQLNNFQTKYFQAENIIKLQKNEIQQLNHTHSLLENKLNSSINSLKTKLQEKIDEAAHLPQAIKTEKIKVEKLSKQNCELITRLQEVKHELALTRAKLVEAAQKRTTTVAKLKSGEKDLKIFKNQNNVLKSEKRALVEELKKLKNMNDDLTKRNSQSISRQKERGESQQRMLQKKILDLELELTRCKNSASELVEERDKLIAELHQQLNTLVHNFEVSQKHIRMLRKHIHAMSTNNPPIPERSQTK